MSSLAKSSVSNDTPSETQYNKDKCYKCGKLTPYQCMNADTKTCDRWVCTKCSVECYHPGYRYLERFCRKCAHKQKKELKKWVVSKDYALEQIKSSNYEPDTLSKGNYVGKGFLVTLKQAIWLLIYLTGPKHFYYEYIRDEMNKNTYKSIEDFIEKEKKESNWHSLPATLIEAIRKKLKMKVDIEDTYHSFDTREGNVYVVGKYLTLRGDTYFNFDDIMSIGSYDFSKLEAILGIKAKGISVNIDCGCCS